MNTEDFKVKFDKNKNLLFEGNLTLKNIDKIAEKFRTGSEKNKVQKICLKNITDIDVSFLQILLSYRAENEEVNFDFDINKEIEQLINQAGFDIILT